MKCKTPIRCRWSWWIFCVERTGTTGKLFVVGDANQFDLHRFRGADVKQFQKLALRRAALGGDWGLTVNFPQPSRPILDFTNALLGHRLADYEPLRAFQSAGQSRTVRRIPVEARVRKKAVPPRGRLSEADWIARRLSAMIGLESLVVDRGVSQK